MLFIKRYVSTTALILLLSVTANAQNLPQIADSIRKAYKIPEIAYTVVSADRVLEFDVKGYHRADSTTENNKAAVSDYFHLGSNTKAITGFIAGYLVESNKINWNTKFFSLFPEWKSQSDTAYANITLLDLLSHRARIQPYTSGAEYKMLPIFKGSPAAQRKLFARYLLKQKPVNKGKEVFNYSNAGYSIAALMLEKVSGKTWEQLVEEVLTEKLHLNYKLSWPNKYQANQPWGHWIEKGKLTALPPTLDYNLNLAEPAGDISMPLPDYAKFIQLNLQGLGGKDNLLKADTYHFLHLGRSAYSIGWGNVKQGGKYFSDHSGSAGTFFCYTLIDHSKGLGYIIIANSATEKTQQGIFALLEQLEKKYKK